MERGWVLGRRYTKITSGGVLSHTVYFVRDGARKGWIVGTLYRWGVVKLLMRVRSVTAEQAWLLYRTDIASSPVWQEAIAAARQAAQREYDEQLYPGIGGLARFTPHGTSHQVLEPSKEWQAEIVWRVVRSYALRRIKELIKPPSYQRIVAERIAWAAYALSLYQYVDEGSAWNRQAFDTLTASTLPLLDYGPVPHFDGGL